MRNPKIDVCILKSRISALDFYQQERQNLKTSGSNTWKEAGTCPFHNDRKAGSFRINSINGAFMCFSCGTKGGDIIAFTQKKYGLSFVDTIRKLSSDWGVQ